MKYILLLASFIPSLAFASVESSLYNIQERFIGTLLPTLAILGFVAAAFSYLMGHQNARAHLVLAIIGAVVGFGASSIVSFIHSLIQ